MTEPKKKTVQPSRPRPWRQALTVVACLVIIAAGLGLADYIKKTAPKAQKRPPERHIPRVNTVALHPVDHQIVVGAMGTVIPAREMTLKSRVAGQIESLHPEFAAGGIIGRGQRLLKIDPKDYQLALARKESQLANAEYEYKVEMGYQEVARQEWALLNNGEPANAADVELALRKPHLAKARSDLTAAQAELEQARLNLARTDIVSPFNAFIRATHVEIGSQVSTQDALAELVGTDEYWIRVPMPVDRLKWIRIPGSNADAGAPATIHFRGHQRPGRVVRLLGDLELQGRMARILVAVEDPLGLSGNAEGPTLLIGEYVRVEIHGQQLSNVYRIPRHALRDNDSIWLVAADGTLQVRPVVTVWQDDRHVLIDDQVGPGNRLVVSDLATPVDGMPVEALEHESPADPNPSLEEDSHHG
jgi:RND family efflux transporter MFP subunit